jgi:hypothetical protein
VDINEIEKGTDFEMDALELSWFVAYRTAEAARRELLTAADGKMADLLARIDRAERQKREIMRQIHALEDSLIT